MALTSDDIRAQFIHFYAKKQGHTFVPSSPSVPHDDPTLLFTNAGMNQFKPLFLGKADPTTAMGKLSRAVNSQKCIRAGGKHNDLDDVGKDTYHHTFFEMLGTWSFGDYFKKESIDWGWELLTKVFGIPGDRLYATYFGGNKTTGLEPDLEARDLWRQYLPEHKVIPGSMKDNFWEMGETGPCGPCSELHFDRIGGRDASKLVNTGDPDVLEIWNHVFIQFNREEDGSLRSLPAKHVDTGMGFERLVSVLQGVRSNYDTDVFMPLFAAIERVTGSARPYRGKLGAADVGNVDTAYRVIADHIRTLTFAITDGAIPSNEGRGYVLRRILRRAVRYGRQTLGARVGFFAQLVPVVVERFGEFYPELRKDPARVTEIIREEEESFGRTLERGCVLFDEACVRAYAQARLQPHLQTAGAKATAKRMDASAGGAGTAALEILVPGSAHLTGTFRPAEMTAAWADGYFGPTRGLGAEDAFKLYDTYGFPVDLTVLMAEERGLRVDTAGFEKLMDAAREKARAGGKFGVEQLELALSTDAVAKLRHMGVSPTADLDKFHGRDIRAVVKAIYNGTSFDQHVDTSIAGVKPVAIVLDRTNFYAEMGGQAGDGGRMVVTREQRSARDEENALATGGEFKVEDTRVSGGYVIHIGRVSRREIRVGDEVQLTLDHSRRGAVASNHTATHLLNLALADTLGPEVNQKGSMVAPDRFRFDFTHGKPVSPEEIAQVETSMRTAVRADLTVYAEAAPLDVARRITRLRAVFGEAYPDPVRVVCIGRPIAAALAGEVNKSGFETSIEFCGGTHVEKTGAIGDVALLVEEAVAKGVRRLTGVTGVAARAAIEAGEHLAQRVKGAAALTGDRMIAEVVGLVQELEQLAMPLSAKQRLRAEVSGLQDRVKQAQKQAAAGRAEQVVATARSIAASPEYDQGSFIVTTIEAGADREALTAALNAVRAARPRSAVMLISTDAQENKLTIIAGVPEGIIKRGLNAGDWVKAAGAPINGRGGGKPDLAQGGGTDITKVREVIAAAKAHAFAKAPN
ncbi:MAG: alanine--tRNA ligase [Phycisphaerales bacterium]